MVSSPGILIANLLAPMLAILSVVFEPSCWPQIASSGLCIASVADSCSLVTRGRSVGWLRQVSDSVFATSRRCNVTGGPGRSASFWFASSSFLGFKILLLDSVFPFALSGVHSTSIWFLLIMGEFVCQIPAKISNVVRCLLICSPLLFSKTIASRRCYRGKDVPIYNFHSI